MYLPVRMRISRQKAKFPFSMHVFQEKVPPHLCESSASNNLIKKTPHRSDQELVLLLILDVATLTAKIGHQTPQRFFFLLLFVCFVYFSLVFSAQNT